MSVTEVVFKGAKTVGGDWCVVALGLFDDSKVVECRELCMTKYRTSRAVTLAIREIVDWEFADRHTTARAAFYIEANEYRYEVGAIQEPTCSFDEENVPYLSGRSGIHFFKSVEEAVNYCTNVKFPTNTDDFIAEARAARDAYNEHC